ncbi:hypothetical protein [Halogranum amylolyticum]|uniref:hypothetical protein n=1 Tax=Halogranum amylolyticum TaxID=660520 RepID=UPI000A80990B
MLCTLVDDVIPYTATVAAQGEGDTRFAINLLREAGNIANRCEEQTVTTNHVEEDSVALVFDATVLSNFASSDSLDWLTTEFDQTYPIPEV